MLQVKEVRRVRPRTAGSHRAEQRFARLLVASWWTIHWRAAREAWRAQRSRLRAHPLFAGCSDRELKTLLRWGDEAALDPGVVLLPEDGLGSCLVAVLSGRLNMTRRGRPVGVVGAGGWVGDIAILGMGPQAATVSTATACEVFVLGARPVLSFAVTFGGLRQGLFPGLTEDAAAERVKVLRREGLARWKAVRAPVFGELTASPPWLRRFPSRCAPRVLFGVPPADHRAPPLPQPLSRRARAAAVCLIALVTAACSMAFAAVRLPYYSFEGVVRPTSNFVRVSGLVPSPRHGELLLPIVVRHHCTGFAMVRDWVDGVGVVSSADLYGNVSGAAQTRVDLELMEAAKRSAIAAARTVVGNKAAESARISISTGTLGGPSGGLAFALDLLETLGHEDLTAGHIVVATGTMASDGAVGEVGGVRLKTIAARAAGADLMLVPRANLAEAAANAGGMKVVAVDDLRSAVAALVALGPRTPS